ncbi:DctP family TRAP transporter solute-binding subunit [candidate division KSB3 bacterium]|uniref:DctP family TRAP transporter solute-binding subunit n=1 Tax=candidate division KSB3 bacterium TaxID=2044937 RepID=A0A9D5JY84_9BACT|nr:DctP family TRAP transporter solute-binding subunit [candidate division KSB3 bacterium]MBD3326492.1 DctP family TRAP transporter solute-binding subunit [candidate division KSB3 bacterium]
MEMKKWVVVGIIMMLVVASGGSSLVLAKTTLRLAHVYNLDNAWHKGSALAAKLVKERTNGEIEIEIFPASQLGTEEQITEAVIFGSIDICVSGAGQIGNLFKPINVTEMPYTFQDIPHVLRFAKSEIGQQMFADLEEEFAVKVLGASSYGIRQIVSNKPIRTPDDLEGMKFRVPEQAIWIEVIKAMGANPTPIAYSEAYMALQQKLVDGLDNPLSGIKSMKFYEVADYINLTSHVTICCFFLMNDMRFQGVSQEHQEIILEAFDEASQHIADILMTEDQELGSFFEEKGLTIIKPDIEAFRKATAEMPQKFRKWWIRYGEDLHQRIQNL